MAVFQTLNLYTSIQQADFKKLLNGRDYLIIQGQMIFEKDGEVFITTIDDKRDDFTAEDYMALPEGAPFELINGKLVYMPSPFNDHQQVSMSLSFHISLHVRKNKTGVVRAAPFDVHFDENNIYQPDLMFISNERKYILQDWVKGAPDFIVEIISFGTKSRDKGAKMKTYGQHGVREYWLIDPDKRTVEVFHNEKGKMVSKQKFENEGTIESIAIEGFSIRLSEIFED